MWWIFSFLFRRHECECVNVCVFACTCRCLVGMGRLTGEDDPVKRRQQLKGFTDAMKLTPGMYAFCTATLRLAFHLHTHDLLFRHVQRNDAWLFAVFACLGPQTTSRNCLRNWNGPTKTRVEPSITRNFAMVFQDAPC
jgi:hypothetical protein